MGCHETKSAAEDQQAALYADETDAVAASTFVPQLVNVPNVHLASVGTWETSTGEWECTAEQLAAIVAASQDPGIRTPILKLGHQDRLSGIEWPALGRIQNLRLSDDGMDLYGDFVGVPSWFAEVMGSAYPDRSVEVFFNYVGATGHKHDAVLTAVALLGVTAPAIESLEDIAALYSDPPLAASGPDCRAVELLRLKERRMGMLERLRAWASGRRQSVQASVSISEVYDQFYEALPQGSWAWIREVYTDFIIVDNGNGDLYRLPWTEGTDGKIVYGEAVRVEVQYVEVSESEQDESEIEVPGAAVMMARFCPPAVAAAAAVPSKPMGGRMDTKDLLARLGLPEDASDEDIEAKLAEIQTPSEVVEEPTPLAIPEGAVVMDEAQHAELVAAARKGETAFEQLRIQRRDGLINAAVAAGKFPPARREHYAKLFDTDEEGTVALLESLTPGLVPVEASGSGHAGAPLSEMPDSEIWDKVAGFSTVLGKEG